MINKRRFNIFLIFSALILIIVGLFFYFVSLITQPASYEAQEKEVVIEQGDGSSVIADILKEKGLIKNKTAFHIYSFIERVSSKLQAGTYKLNTGMNIKEIIKVLSGGELLSNERTIKIIEGWTNKEIGEYLEKQEICNKDDFFEVASVKDSRDILPDESYDFLIDKDESVDLEGYLFPDTYRIFKDSEAKDIIKKMLDNFDDKLTVELREEIKNQEKTISEIIIMASILEKEVRKDMDRKMAADLFYRRLKVGMPLQSDATVNYATGKSERQPTYSDLEKDSPYNTYLHKGLPPGPICNSSISAIKAAIYPVENGYWFYLNKEDGTTVWSETGEEHAANKAKYLD